MIKYRLISGLSVAALLLLTGCPGEISGDLKEKGPDPKDIASLEITPLTITLNAPATFESTTTIFPPGGGPMGGVDHAGLDSATYLTATAVMHDGTKQRVSGVTWRSSQPSLITVSEDGLARALHPGTTGAVTVTAIHKEKSELSATANITLVNDGGAAVEIE
ncbi:Bacterial Ig-like domain (group 2) [compost metagenome]